MKEYLSKCPHCKLNPETHKKCVSCDILIHSKEYFCKNPKCNQPHTLKINDICIGCDDQRLSVV